MATQFETCTCSRCGGSGKYSFNSVDGDRCYGCLGTGVKLTKRGAAAKAHYIALITRPVDGIEVGDFVLDYVGMSSTRKWFKVASVALSDGIPRGIRLDLARGGVVKHSRICAPDETLTWVNTEEQRVAAYEAALAFEKTLTKTGTVAKRKTN